MLEPIHIDAVKNILTRYKKDKGIIVTDHYYHDVLEIANKKTILKDGVLLEISNLEELCSYGYIPKR